MNRPTLVLAHNKTLRGPAVFGIPGLFSPKTPWNILSRTTIITSRKRISPTTDTYIEKDSAINDEIDKLRHSATSALSERRDVIIVASVSCIYSLGDPIDYRTMVISLRPGMEKDRDELLKKLVELQYERNDIGFARNKFRVHGDVVEIWPAESSDTIIRVEFFGDEVDRITEINAVTGEFKADLKHVAIYPPRPITLCRGEKMMRALKEIEDEMHARVAYFKENDKLIEAQRIEQRTMYDIEMLGEIGFCKGIENYSRVLSGRKPGSAPFTLLDYFPDDFLLFVDESPRHLARCRRCAACMPATAPANRRWWITGSGCRRRTTTGRWIFDEFYDHIGQVIFVSATPGDLEKEKKCPDCGTGHPAHRAARPRKSACARRRGRSTI